MKIKDFIRSQVLLPRLKQHGVLVVYDPEKHYRELCLELETGKIRVIDTSESSISDHIDALSETYARNLEKVGSQHIEQGAPCIQHPARTRGEKCRPDKLLAIAHDLEHLYVEKSQTKINKRTNSIANDVDVLFDI